MSKIKRIFYINNEGKSINIEESPRSIYSYPHEVIDEGYSVLKELEDGEILPVNTNYYKTLYIDTIY